jgi:hypothetical protein
LPAHGEKPGSAVNRPRAGTSAAAVSHALSSLVANGGAYRALSSELLAAGISDDALLSCVREAMLSWVGEGADGGNPPSGRAAAVQGREGADRGGKGEGGVDHEGGVGTGTGGRYFQLCLSVVGLNNWVIPGSFPRQS